MPVTVDCDVQESEMKSAQLAKQDAELAAAKQESATHLDADKKEQAALHKAHHATLKASMHCAETCSPHALTTLPPPLPPRAPFPTPTLGCRGIELTCALVAACGISSKPYPLHCNPNATG